MAARESFKDCKGTNKKQKVISDNTGRYTLVSLTPVLIKAMHLENNKETEDKNIIRVSKCIFCQINLGLFSDEITIWLIKVTI